MQPRAQPEQALLTPEDRAQRREHISDRLLELTPAALKALELGLEQGELSEKTDLSLKILALNGYSERSAAPAGPQIPLEGLGGALAGAVQGALVGLMIGAGIQVDQNPASPPVLKQVSPSQSAEKTSREPPPSPQEPVFRLPGTRRKHGAG